MPRRHLLRQHEHGMRNEPRVLDLRLEAVDDGRMVCGDLQADAVKRVVLCEDRAWQVRVSIGIHGVHHVHGNNGPIAMEPRVWMKCMESIFGGGRVVGLGGSGSGSGGRKRPGPWLGRREATDQERCWLRCRKTLARWTPS